MHKLISVVVCTYNRAELLLQCLNSLVDQTIDQSLYEVIVVDNNSSDSTQQVAKEFSNRYNNFKVIQEKRPGKSYASNTGIDASKGNYIAFIDDDAKANQDWLERIINAFETVKPEPAAVGGKICPWYEQPPPGWFTDDLEIRSWGEEKCFLKPPHAKYGFSGSNMAFPRKVFEEYGGFSIGFGPVGDKFAMGEDTEIFYRIYQHYPWFWYDPAIQVLHRVSIGNMTISCRLRRAYKAGSSNLRMYRRYLPLVIIMTFLYIIFLSSIFPFRIWWWRRDWQRDLLRYAEPIAGYMGVFNQAISQYVNRIRGRR